MHMSVPRSPSSIPLIFVVGGVHPLLQAVRAWFVCVGRSIEKGGSLLGPHRHLELTSGDDQKILQASSSTRRRLEQVPSNLVRPNPAVRTMIQVYDHLREPHLRPDLCRPDQHPASSSLVDSTGNRPHPSFSESSWKGAMKMSHRYCESTPSGTLYIPLCFAF